MKRRFYSIIEFFINYSGILCLIDCILLPLIVLVFGFLNVFNNFEQFEYIAEIIELCLIIPFGCISLIVNFKRTENVFLFLFGFLGIAIVVLSHFLKSHIMHTVFSLLGCFMLILSNFLSRKSHKHHHKQSDSDQLIQTNTQEINNPV
uniref:MerC mercury resistance protein, putative n=1 Tax=Theileria annulata TaxID=5874 RepID=A0A3B0N396_THEAN